MLSATLIPTHFCYSTPSFALAGCVSCLGIVDGSLQRAAVPGSVENTRHMPAEHETAIHHALLHRCLWGCHNRVRGNQPKPCTTPRQTRVTRGHCTGAYTGVVSRIRVCTLYPVPRCPLCPAQAKEKGETERSTAPLTAREKGKRGGGERERKREKRGRRETREEKRGSRQTKGGARRRALAGVAPLSYADVLHDCGLHFGIALHCRLTAAMIPFWITNALKPGSVLDVRKRAGCCYEPVACFPCIWHV